MKDSKQAFLSLIEPSHDPIILLRGRTVAEGNQAALDLFGCTDREQMLNRCLSDLSPQTQPDGTRSAVKERKLLIEALQKDALRFEWTFARIDGRELPTEVTLSAIRFGSEELLRATLRRLAPPEQKRSVAGGQHFRSMVENAIEGGAPLHFEGHLRDVTERKMAEERLVLQLDLALELSRVHTLEEALSLTLNAMTRMAGCHAAAIYLRNREAGTLELASFTGLPDEVVQHAAALGVNLETPLYFSADDGTAVPFREVLLAEGIRSVALIPALYREGLIACFSYDRLDGGPIAMSSHATLELIGVQFGTIVARLKTGQELQNDLERLKQAEESLEAKTKSLEEVNVALKVLLDGREKASNELAGRILSNAQQLIQPYLQKLKESTLDISQTAWVEIIATNLREITSPFLRNLNAPHFTPRELEIIQLLKQRKTSREIAELMHIKHEGVEIHRHNIRKKLGLANTRTNLQAYLLSLV